MIINNRSHVFAMTLLWFITTSAFSLERNQPRDFHPNLLVNDPTKPLIDTTNKQKVLNQKAGKQKNRSGLTAIFWSKKNPRAIVNDRLVGLGDTVNNKKITTIEKNRIGLRTLTGVRYLSLVDPIKESVH